METIQNTIDISSGYTEINIFSKRSWHFAFCVSTWNTQVVFSFFDNICGLLGFGETKVQVQKKRYLSVLNLCFSEAPQTIEAIKKQQKMWVFQLGKHKPKISTILKFVFLQRTVTHKSLRNHKQNGKYSKWENRNQQYQTFWSCWNWRQLTLRAESLKHCQKGCKTRVFKYATAQILRQF